MMPISFSHYLQKIRYDKELTQQNLLDFLINSDDVFSKLDLTTLSRWERGVTTPKLEKQLLLARLLGSDVALLIDPDTNVPKLKQQSLHKIRNKELAPYAANNHSFYIKKYNSLKENIDLSHQLHSFYIDYLGITLTPDFLLNKMSHVHALFNHSNNLVAHLHYNYLPLNTNEKYLNSNNIINNTFIKPPFENGVILNIMSTYSYLSTPRTIMILSILNLLRQHTHIKSLCINCHTQDGFDLYNLNTNYRIISHGRKVQSGGVKHLGRRYKYIQILINVESILSSSVVSDMVPFTDEYINILLMP